jgi:hypothetical protein
MTIPNATFVEWLQNYAQPRGYYASRAAQMLLDDKEFMARAYVIRKDIEDYVAREYLDDVDMSIGVRWLGNTFVRWRKYEPKSWRTCPKCRSRATKVMNINLPTPFHCQTCGHDYTYIAPRHRQDLTHSTGTTSSSPDDLSG